MQIIISNNADKPIYEQITSQIKAMIMSGELQGGDTIPSVRTLAKNLHVSVITVRKAYETGKFCGREKPGVLYGGTAAAGRGTSAPGSRDRQGPPYPPGNLTGYFENVLYRGGITWTML